MRSVTQKFQFALFPALIYKPKNNNWMKLASSIIDNIDAFANGKNITYNHTDKIPNNVPRINLNSEDGNKSIVIAPEKIDIFYDMGPLEVTISTIKDVELFFNKVFDVLTSEIESWKRIGVIVTHFLDIDGIENYDVIRKKIFVNPKENWSNTVVEITAVPDSDTYWVVRIEDAILNKEKNTPVNGYLASIDVNNIPRSDLVFNKMELQTKFKKFFDSAKLQNIYKVLEINNSDETNLL